MRSTFRAFLTLLIALAALTSWPGMARANSNSFVDDDNSRFEPFIETAKDEGLINGCNPPDNDRVCPQDLVTRGSMAVMIARAIEAPPSGSNHFTDDDGHVAETSIDGLVDVGIPMGCAEGLFCPDRPITRGEMAALITKAFDWDVEGNTSEYTDLEGSQYGGALARLAARGGILSCDAPLNERLCPRAPVRRDEAVFALVSVMGLEPATRGQAPSDNPALDFGDGFYDLRLWDGRSPSSRNRVSITPDGVSGSALQVAIPKGSHYGADFKLHLDDAAEKVPEELYFRYYLKLDDDWATTSSGKLPGFSGVYGSSGKGGYQSSPGDPGWSARLMFAPNDGDDRRVDLGYYVYHLGQERRYGDGFGWNETGKLQPGEWYCLEGAVEMNTPGLADGALRAWVDGTPAFDLSGLEFRRPSEPEIKIESFWFDVYYGGKAVAPQDLGLTIDEVIVDTSRVGCGAGRGVDRPAEGDFNGDGYRDRARWEECPTGACLRLEMNRPSGTSTLHRNAEGAWFDIDSHQVGMAAGDIDGDGRADIVYPGRCQGSVRCWRAHTARGGLGDGEDWGSGSRFSPATSTITLGDWNGDGLDDLAYQGVCGDDVSCWRVHLSDGENFDDGRSWGEPPPFPVRSWAADINGDGRDDLVFRSPCDESECWFAALSTGRSFARPTALGPAVEGPESEWEWIDFDGDSHSDLVSWANSADESWVDVRFGGGTHLSQPLRVASPGSRILDVSLRRLSGLSTVQAMVEVRCDGGHTCVEHLMSPTPRSLVDATEFLEIRWERPGAPRID